MKYFSELTLSYEELIIIRFLLDRELILCITPVPDVLSDLSRLVDDSLHRLRQYGLKVCNCGSSDVDILNRAFQGRIHFDESL